MLDRIAAKYTAARMSREDGVTAIEYGLIAALIAVVIIAALILIGTRLNVTFSSVGNSLPSN
jgi:pilus assembly protein Flp/PilA